MKRLRIISTDSIAGLNTPEAIVAILKSARADAPDPRLESVLQAFRSEWMSLGRRRYPSLGDALEDALQIAMLKVISPAKLDGLQDVARVEAWARSIFIHAVLDVVRDLRRHGIHGTNERTSARRRVAPYGLPARRRTP